MDVALHHREPVADLHLLQVSVHEDFAGWDLLGSSMLARLDIMRAVIRSVQQVFCQCVGGLGSCGRRPMPPAIILRGHGRPRG